MTSSWQDDLPPIPSERIIKDAVREGSRRRARRRERQQRMLTFGGVAAAAVAVVVIASLGGGSPSDDDAATDTDAAATAAAAATVAPTETEAASPSTAPEATTADGGAASATTEATEAEATTSGTEGPDPLVSDDVIVAPAEVWELGPGGAVCGPTDAVVTYRPDGGTVTAGAVRWSVAQSFGETPMTVTDGVATATIGPFPADTLGAGDDEVLVVAVSAIDASGAVRALRSPADVVLRDCAG